MESYMKNQKNYYTHARPDLLSLVPKTAKKILDVGCGEGVLGKQLKQSNNDIEIMGVEIDQKACETAKRNLDLAILGDIEKIDLPFKENYFDCVIAGDVLEHLVDPWDTLKKLKPFLKEGGLIISSIPNIRYYKVLIRLFRGYWDYMDQGILDKTHLRFFSLINIKELYEGAGFKIKEIRRNMVSARGFRILNYLSLNQLKEFLTYQYYIVATKDSNLPQQKPKRQITQF